jgi:hypothetical protein
LQAALAAQGLVPRPALAASSGRPALAALLRPGSERRLQIVSGRLVWAIPLRPALFARLTQEAVPIKVTAPLEPPLYDKSELAVSSVAFDT